ncbi:MAG: glycosyltransferase [Gemmatimonadota bacterium]
MSDGADAAAAAPTRRGRIRVCLAGTWDAEFGRNVILLRLLDLSDCDITTCRVDLWAERGDSVVRRSRLGLVMRSLRAYPLLAWRFLLCPRPDIVIVPYPGHFDVPLVAALCAIRRVPLMFDMFISLYDTIVSDRRLAHANSWTARLSRAMDRLACRLADTVLADTPEHAAYFAGLSGLPPARFRVLPVGTRENVFHPVPSIVPDPDVMLFYGTFIPLQGVDTIVRAAKLLEPDGVTVRIIGDGQEHGRTRQLAADLDISNVEWTGMVPLDRLPLEIARAGICLGIFGTTGKADRVVPNKVYECLAAARPVVTGDTTAIRSAFAAGELMAVPPGDAAALALAIRRLRADVELRERVRLAGHARFRLDYSELPLSATLRSYIEELVRAR